MKKYYIIIILIIFVAIVFTSCSSNNNKDEITEGKKNNNKSLITDISNSKGYKLMEQKCFICHFDKPDPSKRATMIAPPMLRIQEHYKPSYPNKDEFVKAIVTWAKHPSETNTLMPGAVRKFDVMPKLNYEDADVALIAETLFEIDFGTAPGMRMGNSLQLNNKKKWKLNNKTIAIVDSIKKQLEKFRSDDILIYNQLGKDIFDEAKIILLDTSYSETMFNQLHNFFNDIEENIHILIASKTLNNAKKQQLILINKFNKFSYYFE